MRTIRLKQLIDEVLKSLPTPHTEDVIEDVFLAIEADPLWRKTYDELVYELGKPVVNSWGGFWIAHAEGRVGENQAPATRGTLLDSYSKLVNPAVKRSKKVKEPAALKLMHDHFLEHRADLPATIRDHRDLIVTLIMEGVTTETAFSRALEKPSFAR
jgi:hypothetical protein